MGVTLQLIGDSECGIYGILNRSITLLIHIIISMSTTESKKMQMRLQVSKDKFWTAKRIKNEYLAFVSTKFDYLVCKKDGYFAFDSI